MDGRTDREIDLNQGARLLWRMATLRAGRGMGESEFGGPKFEDLWSCLRDSQAHVFVTKQPTSLPGTKQKFLCNLLLLAKEFFLGKFAKPITTQFQLSPVFINEQEGNLWIPFENEECLHPIVNARDHGWGLN